MARLPVPVAVPIVLTPAERVVLERWARGRRVPRRLVRRARIVLRAVAGESNAAIARALRTDRECVGRWRGRFAAERLAGLQREAPRPGRPPAIPAAGLQALAMLLRTTTQVDGRPWSPRALARALARTVRISPATVQRCCQASGLAPHWVTAARLRRPFPGFDRLTQVLGGYLTEVDTALVVGGDVVGPNRPVPPAWPRKPGPPPTPLARYAVRVPPVIRVLPGTPVQNRVIDWLQFLAYVAARVPRGYWVHVFADNRVTHLHPAVPAWLTTHPQVVVHLVPADRPLPRWFLRRLREWVGPRLPRNRVAEITTVRAAVAVLRPRSVRRRRPSFWMATKSLVRFWCGSPRWHLPPDPWGWGPRPKTWPPPASR
jgi:transposase